jgi:hypothetical protein
VATERQDDGHRSSQDGRDVWTLDVGMSPGEWAREAAAVWDIAVPSLPDRLPGARMAGFCARTADLVDLEVVPYPAATVVIDLGGELVSDDASGQPKRGSVVAGLAPGPVRALGREIECLQMRLSPVRAHAVLGAPSDLGGTLVTLVDPRPADLGAWRPGSRGRVSAFVSIRQRIGMCVGGSPPHIPGGSLVKPPRRNRGPGAALAAARRRRHAAGN